MLCSWTPGQSFFDMNDFTMTMSGHLVLLLYEMIKCHVGHQQWLKTCLLPAHERLASHLICCLLDCSFLCCFLAYTSRSLWTLPN